MNITASEPNHDAHRFSFSEITDRYDNQPQRVDSTWGDFCWALEKPDSERGQLSQTEYQALDPANPEDKELRANEKDGPVSDVNYFVRSATIMLAG